MKNGNVLFWSIAVALGGFLFGFDTAVISGAEQAIQQYWKLSSLAHGFTISVALIGTVIGSLAGSIPSDRLGRRTTLIVIALIYYAPRIFEMAGLGRNSSLFSTVGIGVVNFLFTLIALNFIDRIGRKTLMMIGSVGLIVTLRLVSRSFYLHDLSGWNRSNIRLYLINRIKPPNQFSLKKC